jgi:hypothetical protein
MSSEDAANANNSRALSSAEQAIIEMMKRNQLEGVPIQGQGGAAQRHTFWDTQVRRS